MAGIVVGRARRGLPGLASLDSQHVRQELGDVHDLARHGTHAALVQLVPVVLGPELGDGRGAGGARGHQIIRITSYNVCYTKLLRSAISIDSSFTLFSLT